MYGRGWSRGPITQVSFRRRTVPRWESGHSFTVTWLPARFPHEAVSIVYSHPITSRQLVSLAWGLIAWFLSICWISTYFDKKPIHSKTVPALTHTFPLPSGDLLLMRSTTQSKWLHSIPKRSSSSSTAGDSTASWAGGGRINITFRNALERGGTENYYWYVYIATCCNYWKI